MGVIASQITSLAVVYSAVYSGADQRKHQSSASLAFVRGIHRWPVNSPHKRPVTRNFFPFDDVIMYTLRSINTDMPLPHLSVCFVLILCFVSFLWLGTNWVYPLSLLCWHWYDTHVIVSLSMYISGCFQHRTCVIITSICVLFLNKNIIVSNTGRNKWYTIYLKQRLQTHKYDGSYIDGLIQERRNSIANALELRLFPLTQRCVHLSMSICPDYV